MKSKKFDECNLVLKAGNNPNTNDLDASRCIDPQTNMPFIVAKFELDEDELKKVKETGEVWVCIMGNQWPPVLPTVHHPFNDHGFVIKEKGLPVAMRYREEVEAMLKKLYFDSDWMTDDFWNDFLQFMSEKFDFVEFGNKLMRGDKNGHSIEKQLSDCERMMLKIMSKDQVKKFKMN